MPAAVVVVLQAEQRARVAFQQAIGELCLDGDETRREVAI